jgi:N-acetylneuraminate lyase
MSYIFKESTIMHTKTSVSHIKGVIPAMFSTFDENEQLDLDRARVLIDYLIGEGVHGLYITGSTGEGFLMSDEERKTFAQAVVSHVNGRVPVIVHVGAIGTLRSIDLAKHAQGIKADAISSVPPFYYYFSGDEIYRYYSDISSAVDLPMIVYNIALAGLMNNDLVRRLASIDGVCGLKFTGTQHHDMATLKEELGPDFMIYSGCDEMATQGLLAGADGLIGSFYNIIPDTFGEIYQLCVNGEYQEAFEIQKIATSFILKAVKYGHFGIMKQLMMDTGIDVGYVRRPFVHPNSQMMAEMWSFLDGLQQNHVDTHMGFISRREKQID